MRSFLLHGVFVLLAVVSLAYVNRLSESSKVMVRERSIAQDISIKVFGEGGQEWSVEGKELVSFGRELSLVNVTMKSVHGYVVKADSVKFDRDKKVGFLRGNVEIRGEAFFVKAGRAVADLKSNILRDEGNVAVLEGRNYVERKDSVLITGEAQKLEFSKDRIIYTGNVKLTRGDALLKADKVTILLSEKGKPVKLIAEGHVRYREPGRKVTAEYAEYDLINDTILLRGMARVEEEKNVLEAEEIVYDKRNRTLRAKGGREKVRTIYVEEERQ